MFKLMKSDHDSAQRGASHWKTVIAQTFDRITQPLGYTFDDMHKTPAGGPIRFVPVPARRGSVASWLALYPATVSDRTGNAPACDRT